jgi:hypothetical protein
MNDKSDIKIRKGISRRKGKSETRPPTMTIATRGRSQILAIIYRAQQEAFGSTDPVRENRITAITEQNPSGGYGRMPQWHGARNSLSRTNELQQVRRFVDYHLGRQKSTYQRIVNEIYPHLRHI